MLSFIRTVLKRSSLIRTVLKAQQRLENKIAKATSHTVM